METLVESDDFVLFRTKVVVGVFTGQFKGCFVGFTAGVCKEYFVCKGGFRQLLCQTQRRLIGAGVAQMPQFIGLFFQGFNQFRWAWPSAFTAMPPAKSMYSLSF